MTKRDVSKFVIFIIILVLAVWSVHHFHLFRRLIQLHSWIHSNGLLGIAVFICIFGVAFSFGVPALALSVFAGTVFGTYTGLAASSAGATLGIIITFYLSRFFARGMVEEALKDNKTFARLDALTEKYGWYMVAIIRFIPFIPAELMNYGFGITKIKFIPYVFWSWLCMLPWLFLYIAGTDAYIDYKADQTIPWSLIVPCAIMLVLLIFAALRFMKLIEPELKKRKK
jgi:uncharacterized membrane protein YdjX (TVP38/TMEM64 family)